ncbi:MAG TPA: lyase family protein [Acidimicrobiia bacterium]|nr:lyase family protein [Acidimicrobiia bacterium]
MISEPPFTTAEMSRVFSAANQVGLFCRFEAELAAAQAQIGTVPAPAAAAIAAACAEPIEDPERLLSRGWEAGTPLIPLLDALRARLDPEAAGSLHRGTTTQDVVDTALVLQMKAGLGLIGESLGAVARRLADLTAAQGATPLVGSTFLQPAHPTTLGAKAALWLAPLLGLIPELRDRIGSLPIQLGGPVGDLASFGHRGPELMEAVADRLGLATPVAPWHTDRSPVTATVALVERVAAAMAKIASDVAFLASAGSVQTGSGGSSSMPGKRNPTYAIVALAAVEVCHAMAAGVLGARAHERERGLGTWHAEWAMVPIVFQAAAASVESVGRCMAAVEIDGGNEEEMTDVVDTSPLIDRVLDAHERQRES